MIDPITIVGGVFIILIAITFISGGVAFALSSKYEKAAGRWFKVATTAGAASMGIALMLILTNSQGWLE